MAGAIEGVIDPFNIVPGAGSIPAPATGAIEGVIDPFNIGGENSPPTAAVPDAGAVGGQFQDLLDQYFQASPAILQNQQAYQPDYTALDLQSMGTALNGTGTTPGAVGLFTGALPAVTGAVNAANTSAAGSAVNNAATLAPGAAGAIAATNPGQANLLNTLTGTATNQLDLGTMIDPNQAAQINQAVQGNFAARGIGSSDPAQLSEALNYFSAGQNLLGQREGEAASVANLNNNLVTSPALNLATTPSTAPGQVPGITNTAGQIAGGAAGNLVTPAQTYDMFNTAYNANAATGIDNANNAAAIQAAGDSY